jgi:hypothetical protein
MAFIIDPAHHPADLKSIQSLFQAYAACHGIDMYFQNFEHELVSLPGKYASPADHHRRVKRLAAWAFDLWNLRIHAR